MKTIEDYVNYEQAAKLKAAGFDWLCLYHYECLYHYGTKNLQQAITPNYAANDGEDSFLITVDDLLEDNNHHQLLSAPTLSQAAKWLREEKRISVRVNYMPDDGLWFADWLHLDSREYGDTDNTFATYEEALSTGIAAVLELIIEKKGE